MANPCACHRCAAAAPYGHELRLGADRAWLCLGCAELLRVWLAAVSVTPAAAPPVAAAASTPSAATATGVSTAGGGR